MLKRVLFRAAAVAVGLGLAAGSAKADFVIDDFTTPTALVQYSLGGGIGSANAYTNASTVTSTGVARSVTVTQTANGTGLAGQTNGFFGSGAANGPQFNLATNPSATANVQLAYTYSTAQNLSAGGTSIQFSFLSSDLNVPFSVQISDGTNTATQSGVASTGAGAYAFGIGSFTGVNTQAVTSVVLSLNRNLTTGGGDVASADFALSNVTVLTPIVTPPPAVPAPPAAVLLLAAVPLLGLARARRMLPV